VQLRTARLCLDCDNVHETQQCPVCASARFAYMTRWVPVPERRRQPRAATARSAEAATYRRLLTANALRPKALNLLGKGALGLAAVSFARWLWRQRTHSVFAA
jgi:D-arabinose 1-dehydrogenase-like Zn-dependent alcohol dehydrogenase